MKRTLVTASLILPLLLIVASLLLLPARSTLATSPTTEISELAASFAAFQKPDDQTLKQSLSGMQYKVTQREGTEPPFRNEYWDNKQPGIYVDIVSGEPLFSSTHKYRSGTGWPSFTQPILQDLIVEKEDDKLFYTRIELRSRFADSHLGHVFNDGPAPTGLRYCINSASLRFVPLDDMEREGYGDFLYLFAM